MNITKTNKMRYMFLVRLSFTLWIVLRFNSTVMWPCSDFVVQCVPGTVGASYVPVTVQMVAGRDVSMVYSALDQILDGVQCSVVWFSVHETSHDGRGESSAVVALGMGSHVMPASTLIDSAVLTHKETVSDVWPTWIFKKLHKKRYKL